MIIFADERLNVKKMLHETVHQGSNKANTIQLVAPITSSATIKIAFALPNGTSTRQYVLESVGEYEEYYMWSVDVPYTVAQNPGRVSCQIVASVGATAIGSSKVDFIVSEGVEYENEELEDDQYNEIISYINEAKVGVENKVSINYNKMALVENPQATYSSECYKAVYSYSAIRGNITSTSGYYVYIYNEETGTGTYEEATGAVDASKTYYTKIISGYEKVTLPDDYIEGINYYVIEKQQSIFNDNNGLYFYIIENGKTKTLRIKGDAITIDDNEVITQDKMKADNISYNDTDTALGASNVQEAIEKVDQKVDAIDVSETIQFVSLGVFSIGLDLWSNVQYLFVKNELAEADNKQHWVYNSVTKEYEEITVTPSNFDMETIYYSRETFYYYDFKHRLLTNSVTQDLMLTLDDETNALFDKENIKIYPFVEMGGTSGNAFGRIKISNLPSQTVTFANITLYGTGIANEATGLKASQIDFTPTENLEAISVQGAIEELDIKVDGRLDSVESSVETLEQTIAQVRSTKTIDAYIVPNSSPYSALWLQDGEGNIFNTEQGTLNQYDNYFIKTEGDYNGNTYTWSGTNFVKVAGNLTLGTGATQAYPGSMGNQNRQTITNHTNQLTSIAQRMTSAENEIINANTKAQTAQNTANGVSSSISSILSVIGNASLNTSNKTLKGAINELLSKAMIPVITTGNNRASGKNGNMYHYWTCITLGDYRIIFGKVDSLDANGNVWVSWGQAMFKSANFHDGNGYVIVPGFTTQTRGDDRGMNEPTHIKKIYTDGFTFYNSNGYTTTGTYVAFGKKI